MADNSLRERIILADIQIIERMSVIKKVIRTIPSLVDLENYPITSLPLAAVVAKLPVPDNFLSSRDGQVDQCISRLRVNINVYFQANENADSLLSNYLDEFWRELYGTPRRNINELMLTELEVTEDNEILPPYMAFQLSCIHTYKHSIGGI